MFSAAQAEAIASLFDGYSNARGKFVLSKGLSGPGKVKGKASTLSGGATARHWLEHLSGEGPGIGIIPLRDDNTVVWGCIDIDVYDLDVGRLEARARRLGLPLVLCRTKSGGIHAFLFLCQPVDAKLIVEFLSHWAAALGYGGSEIFPKQTFRESDAEPGNWLNMPYYNAARTPRYCLRDEVELSLTEFLAFANSMKVSEASLRAMKPLEPVQSVIPPRQPNSPNGGGGGKLEWEIDPGTGFVVDGREKWLTHLVFQYSLEQPGLSVEQLASLTWTEWQRTVDLSRHSSLTFRDALAKAKSTINKNKRLGRKRVRRGLIAGVAVDALPRELPPDQAASELRAILHQWGEEAGISQLSEKERIALLDELVASSPPEQLRQLPQAPSVPIMLAATPGLGKSRGLLELVKEFNRVRRAEEGASYVPLPIWFVAPSHRLCEELSRAYGAGAFVYRGRTHGLDDGKETLCARPEAVDEVQKAGITNVSSHMCRALIKGEDGRVHEYLCRFYDGCRYYGQAQMRLMPR